MTVVAVLSETGPFLGRMNENAIHRSSPNATIPSMTQSLFRKLRREV